MSFEEEIAIRAQGIGKCYEIYADPQDRLKQFVLPRVQELFGQRRTQYFREFWALHDVSFELRKGEAIGIIGRNGSGKSTLLQILCSTLHPTRGDVQINGRVAALLELGAGFNPEFTGRENVYMNASLLGLTNEQIDQRFEAIAAFADIGDFLDQPVKTYSSGMFVRLAFAVIAHVDADILVIDEALAVGDALFTQKCMRFIRKFRERGTLLYVSHDSASVINLCDRALWLDKGKMRMLGPAKSICESYLNEIFKSMERSIDNADRPSTGTGESVKIERLGDVGTTWQDHRQSFINHSNLRNDIELFQFAEHTDTNYGGELACITNVQFLNSSRQPLNWVVGGEKTIVRIEAKAKAIIHKPIFGFMVRDRLGQNLFGDNTYISQKDRDLCVEQGAQFAAEFEFHMPWMPAGDYVIQVALADGTQSDHRQLHWINDALVFRSHHAAHSSGLIGIPMNDIRLGTF